MLDENYWVKLIIELSGALSLAVLDGKQYLAQIRGDIEANKVALEPLQRRIQALEKQLKSAKNEYEILKNATAFFIRNNPALLWFQRWWSPIIP